MNRFLRFTLFATFVAFSLPLFSHVGSFQVKRLSTDQKEKVIKSNLNKASLSERMGWLKKEVAPRMALILEKIKAAENKMTLIVYKKEREVELWTGNTNPEKLKTYSLFAYSGILGPKSQEGDFQIPEGVYKTTHLNPNSNYYLSIGINYPNDNDRKRARKNKIPKPGGDIFIHGRHNTVGCVSIGDHYIEEIFYLTGMIGIKNVKVLISPTRLPLPDLRELGVLEKEDLLREKYTSLIAELTNYL